MSSHLRSCTTKIKNDSRAIVHLPQRTQLHPICLDEKARRTHEKRIPRHHLAPIHPLRDRLKKLLNFRRAPARGPELRDPQRLVPHHRVRLADMRLEASSVRRGAVPVDGEEVKVAVRARGEEILEIGQAGGPARVGDGGCPQSYRACERHHVGLVGGDGVGDLDAAAAVAALVGFVEGEDGRRAVFGNTAFDVGRPDRGGAWCVRPEDGDEFEGGVEAGAWLAVGIRHAEPVVGP